MRDERKEGKNRSPRTVAFHWLQSGSFNVRAGGRTPPSGIGRWVWDRYVSPGTSDPRRAENAILARRNVLGAPQRSFTSTYDPGERLDLRFPP
jgi:hypothetical protein